MSWVTLLTELTAETRNRSNTTNDQTVTDAEIMGYLNREVAKWQQLVILAGVQDYYFTSRTFYTVSGTAAYALAGESSPGARDSIDFFKLLGVSVVVSGNTLTLKPGMFSERDRFSAGQIGWHDAGVITYRMIGTNIGFTPTPDGVYQVFIYGIPTPVRMDGATITSVDGVASWDEFSVIGAAYKIAVKKGLNDLAANLKNEQTELQTLIERSAASRDWGMPERVADVVGYPED